MEAVACRHDPDFMLQVKLTAHLCPHQAPALHHGEQGGGVSGIHFVQLVDKQHLRQPLRNQVPKSALRRGRADKPHCLLPGRLLDAP